MNDLAKALDVIRNTDITQNAKLTIWASLCFAKDCASGKHGEQIKELITKEIGFKGVRDLAEWQI